MASPLVIASARRIEAALEEPGHRDLVPHAREALAAYVADPGDHTRDALLVWLENIFGEPRALDLLGMKPPRRGLVWCCSTIGWVTPSEKFDHRWDAYSDL